MKKEGQEGKKDEKTTKDSHHSPQLFDEDYTKRLYKNRPAHRRIPAAARIPGPSCRRPGQGCRRASLETSRAEVVRFSGAETMTFFDALLLGTLQGLTEFLPVSSTAHLYLAQELLRIRNDQVALSFDVVLHLGTALALVGALGPDVLAIARELALWILRRPARDPQSRALLLPLALGTAPGVLAGLFLLKHFESVRTLGLIGFSMLIACAYFLFSERIAARQGVPERPLIQLSWADGLWIGLAQAAAGLLAGFSRSGFTIATGLNRGLRREDAARFSFLLGLPLITGAGAKALFDLRHHEGPAIGGTILVAGFLSAAIVGYVTVRFLLHFLKTHTLRPFAIYLGLLGLALLALSIARGLPLLAGSTSVLLDSSGR
jgi:undecaprenyl-diphosphatase